MNAKLVLRKYARKRGNEYEVHGDELRYFPSNPIVTRLGPMTHISIMSPTPAAADHSVGGVASTQNSELNSTSLSSPLTSSEINRVNIALIDPVMKDECAICLMPITASTLARLAACPHIFHNSCIKTWHETRFNHGQVPNCPSCRKCGPSTPAWPSFDFYRSFVFGPSGTITLLPHIIVIRTNFVWSSNTKQIIRIVDIQRFKKKRNYIYLYDHNDELIISFRPSHFPQFIQLFIQNIKQNNPHITLLPL